ncbi:NAD(P)H-binding protein [Nocardiopsis lambiniae]|uniref:NAD(P)H-binding protein n=1 Tax=Nocardiopsis lambiniae TaxID=3075539 RepID=A0ABU2M711_9ACTN|nr:NAD(P)H-binding protein [Nocardiopsis sp. DSM 44743]MDT0328463.1 NAD(P)H-binding protein [Nocardiopsis sp. DSM 44743]
MTVLVTGATGNVGRHLVRWLVDRGHPVRALTRTPDRADLGPGVEVVGGDLTDTATLTGAFAGVDAVHLITFGGDGDELDNAADIVDLAVASGTRRATVLGAWGGSPMERAVRTDLLEWTLLAPGEFMSGALEWAPDVHGEGAVRTLSDWPSAVVHEADIAAVAGVALTEGGHGDRIHVLTGPEALTPAARAEAIGRAIGREVAWVRLTEEQERARLRAQGLPEEYVEFGISLATDPPETADRILPTVEEVTGRPARTFADWARDNADAFRS